jgi:hypothetical protein
MPAEPCAIERSEKEKFVIEAEKCSLFLEALKREERRENKNQELPCRSRMQCGKKLSPEHQNHRTPKISRT